MAMEDTLEAFDDDEVAQRLPCPICQRKFNEDVLSRHKTICEKSMKKRRKPFNSQKQRSLGSDIPLERKKIQESVKNPKKKNWKAKHEAFLTNIRAARGTTSSGKGSGGAFVAPAAVVNPDYVQCPHCERRFNEHSAERHIEFCKEQSSRIASKKAGAENLTKLAKRTQYKAPLPGKNRSVPNSGSTSGNKAQRQVLSSKYSNGSYVPSSGDKGDKVSRVQTNSEFGGMLLDSDVTNTKALRRIQSTQSAVSPKETVSRRHSSNASTGNRDSHVIGSRISNRTSNGLSPASNGKVNPVTGGNLFHDDDISRAAASGNRRNRNQERPGFQDDPDGLRQKLGPRFSDLGNMADGSGSGEDSDGCRSIGSGRRKGSRRSNSGKDLLEKESGISVGSDVGSGIRLSKFCYECGTKYPVPHAKYCCECGVRRLCLDT